MALTAVGSSSSYWGASAALHTVATGISIPIGSAVVILCAIRNHTTSVTFTASTTPANAATWTFAPRGYADLNAQAVIAYTLDTTDTITAIVVDPSVSSQILALVCWYSGHDSAGSVVHGTGLTNAGGQTTWAGPVTPAALGDLVVGTEAHGVVSGGLDTDGVTVSRSGTAAATWTTLINSDSIAEGAGAPNTRIVMHGARATAGVVSEHQAEWTHTNPEAFGGMSVSLPASVPPAATRRPLISNPALLRSYTW